MLETTAAPPCLLRAQLVIEQAEGRGDLATLETLAGCYRRRSDLANRYAEVLLATARQRDLAAEYAAALTRSNADDLADELERGGVYIYAAEQAGSVGALRTAAAEYVKLARLARE